MIPCEMVSSYLRAHGIAQLGNQVERLTLAARTSNFVLGSLLQSLFGVEGPKHVQQLPSSTCLREYEMLDPRTGTCFDQIVRRFNRGHRLLTHESSDPQGYGVRTCLEKHQSPGSLVVFSSGGSSVVLEAQTA